MQRACPVCLSTNKEVLYSYNLTYKGKQTVFACNECGMIYASNALPVNYSNSIYEMPGALGSGVSPADKDRLKGVVRSLETYYHKYISILDIGCAQGGMLDALDEQGFKNIMGMDPSEACVKVCRQKGHKAIVGALGDAQFSTYRYDLIILSHVLEHIEDVRSALVGIKNSLTPSGVVYIEVPDAERYAGYNLPFLDFNSEHINHFTIDALQDLLDRCGFTTYGYVENTIVDQIGHKDITLVNGSKSPALWALAKRKTHVQSVMKYVAASQEMLYAAGHRLAIQLDKYPDVAIWGAGEYLCHVLPLVSKNIVAVVDRNVALHGQPVAGKIVSSPEDLKYLDTAVPIVVAAIVAENRIKEDIAKLGLKNPVITLGL